MRPHLPIPEFANTGVCIFKFGLRFCNLTVKRLVMSYYFICVWNHILFNYGNNHIHKETISSDILFTKENPFGVDMGREGLNQTAASKDWNSGLISVYKWQTNSHFCYSANLEAISEILFLHSQKWNHYMKKKIHGKIESSLQIMSFGLRYGSVTPPPSAVSIYYLQMKILFVNFCYSANFL